MKAERITMQIVKNLGNYETVRFEAEFSVEEGETLIDCFSTAKQELENTFNELYIKKELELLQVTHPQFERVCKGLEMKKTDIESLQKLFIIPEATIQYFKEHNLI